MTGFAQLLPDTVLCEQHPGPWDPVALAPGEDVLFPEEEAAIARAVPRRREEFTTVRVCARRALARAGVAPVAIPPGDGRAPRWPPGMVGSLTHCDGVRAAAVAHAGDVAALGIDAEVNAPLPDGVPELIGADGDITATAAFAAAQPEVHAGRLLFSAKESIYKAWYPLAHTWLDFSECHITLAADGRFSGRLLRPWPPESGLRIGTLEGRWAVSDGHVFTAVAVPAHRSPWPVWNTGAPSPACRHHSMKPLRPRARPAASASADGR